MWFCKYFSNIFLVFTNIFDIIRDIVDAFDITTVDIDFGFLISLEVVNLTLKNSFMHTREPKLKDEKG